MLGVSKHRVMGLLRRVHVPVQPGDPRLVYLSDIKASAPDIWLSMEEAAHIKAISG